MSWTEGDRALIRHYLGFAAIFLQAEPRLEAAMTAVQSVSDGGTRPDDSTERLIRGWLGSLARIERRLQELWTEAEALKVDDLGVDPYRGLALVRSEGRRLVGNIARALSTAPRHDAFSSMAPNPDGSPYPAIDAGRYPLVTSMDETVSMHATKARPPCVAPACVKPSFRRGLCAMHYQRLRNHGDALHPTKSKAPNGAGTRLLSGYRQLRRPNHPNACRGGQIREHRLVMSEVLGRPLLPGENVHHKNGVRVDNRPENLEVWVIKQPCGQRVRDVLHHAWEMNGRYNPRSSPYEEDLHLW